MPNVTRYRRTERNREKYRNYPLLNILVKMIPSTGKALLFIIIVVLVLLDEIDKRPRLTGSWTY